MNSGLEKSPELINKDPYEGGWIMKIRIAQKGDLDSLLGSGEYRKLIGK